MPTINYCSHLTCLQPLRVAVEEVEEHEPLEANLVVQKTCHQTPNLKAQSHSDIKKTLVHN